MEWTRLQSAIESTSREITLLARRMKQSIGSNEGAIFDAHLLILQDPDLIKQAGWGSMSVMKTRPSPGTRRSLPRRRVIALSMIRTCKPGQPM